MRKTKNFRVDFISENRFYPGTIERHDYTQQTSKKAATEWAKEELNTHVMKMFYRDWGNYQVFAKIKVTQIDVIPEE